VAVVKVAAPVSVAEALVVEALVVEVPEAPAEVPVLAPVAARALVPAAGT